jgi:hypothetical protein
MLTIDCPACTGSMAMIGLLLVAGIVDGGPILNNSNSDATAPTSASDATSSTQR